MNKSQFKWLAKMLILIAKAILVDKPNINKAAILMAVNKHEKEIPNA